MNIFTVDRGISGCFEQNNQKIGFGSQQALIKLSIDILNIYGTKNNESRNMNLILAILNDMKMYWNIVHYLRQWVLHPIKKKYKFKIN